MGHTYDFTFIMKLIAAHSTTSDSLEVIPTTEDKEIAELSEYNGIQFKDSLKLISSPLRSIVAQTLGGNLDLYMCTPNNNNYANTVNHEVSNGRTEYIDLLTRKGTHVLQPHQIIRVIEQYHHSFSQANALMIWREKWCPKTNIWTHGEAVEDLWHQDMGWILRVVQCTRCNSHMADAFEHFRVTTLNAFGVDPMHYITAPQMAFIRSS